MSRLGAQVCAWAVLVACATGPLLAHETATGVVKERMDQMKEMGRAMKRINDRLKSKRDLTAIAADAERIRDAAQKLPSLFPDGSTDEHSEAKLQIWKQWARFTDGARALQSEADALKEAALAGSAADLTIRVRAVTAACTACHDEFRVRR